MTAGLMDWLRIGPPFDWTFAAKEASLADIGEGPVMDDVYRELANRLFATATAMLEDTIEVAVVGQSPRLTPSQLADNGRRLQAVAREIAVLAEAAVIVANLGADRRRNWRKRSR